MFPRESGDFRQMNKRIGAFLQELRKESRISQSELADALGRPQSYISKCENGAQPVDIPNFVAWCRALNERPAHAFSRLMTRLNASRSTSHAVD